ncbi:hypothetical protein AAF712_013850 [Marasmius tenuissimus]|uniref:DUF6535 domain-containing protein n=1 Tax=Marasmius tenuissimus TaxID=585030 RepID=A0ABR2ZEK7_9AGAR
MDHLSTILGERTPYASPSPSRPQTPLGRLRRHPGNKVSISEEALPFHAQSRSHSRARPGKKFSQDEVSHDGRTNRSASRRARFAPEKDASLYPGDEKAKAKDQENKDVPLTGEEFGENARIWQVYAEEAAKADTAMTDGWNRSMDVLLVFVSFTVLCEDKIIIDDAGQTGLFSAVLTTFIIQSYQNMAPDPVDTTNALLSQLILLQFNDSSAASHALEILNQSAPTREIHWVNGLWFAALACSLSTALITMLAKQWLQAYTPVVSGSPRSRARSRHARYIQLEVWRVPPIINALPLMLHIALLLFFAGLIVLLWSEDLGITIATWVVVTVSYLFYFISICLPLLYPDCPYHHPISDHIRARFLTKPGSLTFKSKVATIKKSPINLGSTSRAIYDDHLDAEALIWLFTNSTDEVVISASLQAISGLPRDFSALQLLRDAGALRLVEQQFEKCFYKDTTIDLEWHLLDPDKASLYCRAWINLTRGTSEQWPIEIVEPLWLLQEVQTHPEASAIASCAWALSSFDSHKSQWELLDCLARCLSAEIQLSQATQCCLLDSIVECMVRWEMPVAVIDQTNVRAVPTLLRMLHLTEDLPSSELQSASAVALYVITWGPVDLGDYRSEARRKAEFCQLLIQSLSVLIENPERFGVTEDLMDIVAKQFCRLMPSVVAQSERFPQPLKKMVRATLSRLYVDRRIGMGIITDALLANVLQLLHPPSLVPEPHRPKLVSMLTENLLTPAPNPDITSWSVRLLEVLLSNCTPAVLKAFTESNGVSAVLRAAKAGGVDSRRLQIESFRTLCTFIHSVTTRLSWSVGPDSGPDPHIEAIFQSDFFEILCSFISSRRWWLFEISGDWMPALFQLCKLRPEKPVWPMVVRIFREFANRNVSEDGYSETIAQLDAMAALTSIDRAESC